MKSIGSYLKDGRLAKKISLANLEDITRIKINFLGSIEGQAWNNLPEYAVVVGFVKNIAKALDLNEREAVALLRRDYPPKKISINPKPDVSNSFLWTPKLTFFVGIAIIVSAILGYLGYQYINFVSPPNLIVIQPKDQEVVKRTNYKVTGKTDISANVRVNNQPALVSKDGSFETEIELNTDTKEIIIKSISRSGKVTTINRKITVELK